MGYQKILNAFYWSSKKLLKIIEKITTGIIFALMLGVNLKNEVSLDRWFYDELLKYIKVEENAAGESYV